jgi:hypothetical protein
MNEIEKNHICDIPFTRVRDGTTSNLAGFDRVHEDSIKKYLANRTEFGGQNIRCSTQEVSWSSPP